MHTFLTYQEKISKGFSGSVVYKGKRKKLLTNYKDIKIRWKEYFERWLNEKFPREKTKQIERNSDIVELIKDKEVWNEVKRVKIKNWSISIKL